MRPRLAPRAPRRSPWPWIRYTLGRVLQVAGLLVTLVAATAFFGTPSTLAMLRMMLVGVLLFVPGWLLARQPPTGRAGPRAGQGGSSSPPPR